MLDDHEFLKKMLRANSLWFLDFPCDPWGYRCAHGCLRWVLFFFEADAYMNFFIWRSRNKICRMYDSYYFDYFLLPDLVLIDFFTRKYTAGDLTTASFAFDSYLMDIDELELGAFRFIRSDYFPNYLQTQKYELL